MDELIQKLQKDHGLTAQQSYGVLNTIKDFIVEKFPMMGGAIDNFFPAESDQENTDTDKAQAAAGDTPTGDTGTTEGPISKGGSILDSESGTGSQPGEEKSEHSLKDMVDPDKQN